VVLIGTFETRVGPRRWWQRLLFLDCSALIFKKGSDNVVGSVKQVLWRSDDSVPLFLFTLEERELELQVVSNYYQDMKWHLVLKEGDTELAAVRSIDSDCRSSIEIGDTIYEDDMLRGGQPNANAYNHQLTRQGRVVATALSVSYSSAWPRIEVAEEIEPEVLLLLISMYRGAVAKRVYKT
jgi:hypothetical protein